MALSIETKCVHLEEETEDRDEKAACLHYGSISFPIYQTATYAHPGVGKSTGFDYSRLQNPTREQLEKIVCQLEGGTDAFALSTGMAAITLLMELFKPGDHLIVDSDLYGGTIRLFDNVSSKNGIKFTRANCSIDDVESLITEERMFTIEENDYYDDFLISSSRLKYNNYPVIDKNNICKGLVRITDIEKKNRKKVILVDHNEIKQSVIGLDEADILEVVDHHKIGDISTKNPIDFRNMSVGSTNTIVYKMFMDSGIKIPKEIAGIMVSGILSDTLILTSPTTTKLDKEAVEYLSLIARIDYKKFGMEMFKVGTSLKGKTKEEIVNTDLKIFNTEEYSFAVSQILTLDYEYILNDMDSYVNEIEQIQKNKDLNFVILAVTDIIENGSYILYTKDAKKYLEAAFNIANINQGYYMEKAVSRKKQIVPYLMDNLLPHKILFVDSSKS